LRQVCYIPDMLKLLFLLTLLCTSVCAETIVVDKPNGRHYIEIFQEQNLWIVDEFLVKPGVLQDRVGHRTFAFETEARRLVEKLKFGKLNNKMLVSLVATEAASQVIWKATNAWDLSWEKKYSQWVADNFDEDFFVRYNLETDCADVAYSIRWIFARINALPMGATLAGTQTLVTHETMKAEWLKLPTHPDWTKDRRFLTALNWLMNNVYTRTLYVDAYPLKIDAESIQPGTINLLGSHTEIIPKMDLRAIPIRLLSSTTPRQVRKLSGHIFITPDAVKEALGGFLQFRWLKKEGNLWRLIPGTEMPWYSKEQYKEDLCEDISHFTKCVYAKLNLEFNPGNMIQGQLQSINEAVTSRKLTVDQGYQACLTQDCSPGTMGWEEWNTPSRDARLLASFQDGYQLVNDLSKLDPTIKQVWETGLEATYIDGASRKYSLKKLFRNLNSGLLSVDPRLSLDARWAMSPVGIDESVKALWNRLLPEKNRLVLGAASCRFNKELCLPDSENFKNLSTLEIDYALKNSLSALARICQTQGCPDQNFIKQNENIWFSSSSPWHSVEKRLGKVDPQAKIFYGGTSYIEISPWLVIDGKRLVNLETSTEMGISNESKIHAVEESKAIFLSQRNQINVLEDGEFKFFARNPYPQFPIKIQAFGEDHFIVSFTSEQKNQGTIFDSEGRMKGEISNFFLAFDSSAGAIVKNEITGARSLYSIIQNRLKMELLPKGFAPGALIGQTNRGWTMTSVTAGEMSLVSYDRGYLYKILNLKTSRAFVLTYGDFLTVSDRLNNNFYIYERKTLNFLKQYTGSQLLGYSQKDFSLLQISSPGSLQYLIKKENRLFEAKFSGDKNPYSFNRDWIVFRSSDPKEYNYVDLEGRDLGKTSTFEVRGRCTTNSCNSSNPLLGINNWNSTDFYVSEVGNFHDLDTDPEPFSQSLSKYQAYEDEDDLQSISMDQGLFFKAHAGVSLYFFGTRQ
jgi:hypothetical protein